MAANFTEIGINFDVFSNTTVPSFGFENMSKGEFINYIPQNANTVTNDFYGIVILTVLLIFLVWLLNDISQNGLFRYNGTRSLGIGLGMVITLGIMMLSVGYATNFIHISIMTGIYIIILLYTIIYNPS